MIALAVACTLAVGLGLLDMPFGFYTLLRVVLCLASAVGFVAARRRQDSLWLWGYGVLAVLYNPVLPIHLGAKSLWIGVNLVTLICVWVGALRFRGAIAAGPACVVRTGSSAAGIRRR
jgi:hypothetical protein